MPGAQWFPGAQINYTRQALRHVDAAHAAGMPAVVSRNETGRHRELSWPELRRQVAALALHLKAQGVGRGVGRADGARLAPSGEPGVGHDLHDRRVQGGVVALGHPVDRAVQRQVDLVEVDLGDPHGAPP